MTITLEQYIRGTVGSVIKALHQEADIIPGRHYRPEVRNTARLLLVTLRGLNQTYLDKILGMRNKLTYAAGLPDDTPLRIGWDRRGVSLEIPKPHEFCGAITVSYLERMRLLRTGWVSTLGLGLQDDPVRLNWGKQDAGHVLVAGETGSGKTVTQQVLAWNVGRNIDPAQGQVIIIDTGKQGNDPYEPWHRFGGLPHLAHPLVTDLTEAEQVIAWTAFELERRGGRGQNTPKIFLFIDELRDIVEGSPAAVGNLAKIARKGRTFGIHLVLATQYPQIQLLGGGPTAAELKRNLTHRLCGLVDSGEAAANVLGVKGSGAEMLVGQGDFLLKDTRGLNRFQVVRLKPSDVRQLPTGQPGRLPLEETPEGVRDVAPEPGRPKEDFTVAQLGTALFMPNPNGGGPMSIYGLKKALNIGSDRATELNGWAKSLRGWALERGYKCLPIGD